MSRIRAEALTKSFRTGFLMRPVLAVKHVDLDIGEGEIFGFIGPNGAGKTTTIKILTGLVRPTGGRAWIQGVPITDPSSRARVGFLPEGTYFHEYLTGREFLDFHARLLGLARRVRREQIETLLERVGMTAAADLQIRRYSKGMRQRIGLAQALVGDPEVLILDEPMSGLDPIGRREMRDLILALRDAGKTVFFSSHILADAEILCDRIALIVAGRIAHQGRLDEMLGRECRGVELIAEGVSEETHELVSSEAVRSVAQGSKFLFEFDDESAAEKALDRIRAEGGHVRSLTPRRHSLEDLLLEETRKERRA